MAELGQNLYHLPTMKGWVGGRHWINSATMVGRHNLALALLQGSGPYGNKLNPWPVAKKHGCSTPQSSARFLLDLFLQGDLESNVRDALPTIARASAGAGGGDSAEPVRRFTHAIVTLPEFQLA